jgi:hypothetical protein
MLPTINITSNTGNFNNYEPKSLKLSTEKKNELLKEVEKSKRRWYDFFGDNLQRFRDDKQFYDDSQWDPFSYTNYLMLGKTPYTFNKLKPIVRQMYGEMANMQPAINLSPTNKEAVDPEEFILITDFVRSLAYSNQANQAYANCFLNQLIGGWGVLEVETNYVDDMSFDQEPKVKGEADPLMVGFDPNCKDAAKTDGDFQFKDYYMSKEEFEATFRRPPPAPGQMLGGQRQFLPYIDEDTVIVTDYYKKVYKARTVVQLTNHETYKIEVFQEDIETAEEEYTKFMTQSGFDLDLIPPLVISNKRKTKVPTIHCYKCVYDEVLEHKLWPSRFLPFVFVDALSMTQDGKQFTKSFINGGKNAQQAYNWVMSEIYNGIARSRREQVWMTREQAKGHEEFLRYPDRQQSHGEYNFDINVATGPIFRPPEELPQTLFAAAQAAETDIYKCLGVYPVNGTELPNNLAGITVNNIVTQGNLTFIQLLQKLFYGMAKVGEIILDLIPKLYDSERIVNVVDITGSARAVTINTIINGLPKNSINDTIYRLQVDPIASFAIQQKELRESLEKLATLTPANAPLVSDLIASTLNTPIAPLLVQRLKTNLPAAILAKEQGKPAPPPPPPTPQQQLQMAQMNKLNSDAVLSKAKAMATGMNVQHTQAQMQQKTNKDFMDYQINNAKIANAQRAEQAKTTATIINANAEVTKAKLDHDAKVTTAMVQMEKAKDKPVARKPRAKKADAISKKRTTRSKAT